MTLSTDFMSMDVFPDMTLNDVKAMVEDDLKVPASSQYFFHNSQPVTDTSKTLTQLNIAEGDMLGMAVQDPAQAGQRRRQQEQTSQQRQQRPREGPDPERVRLHIIGDPRMMERTRQQDPELADAANDTERFHTVWDLRQRQNAQAQADKEEQLALLNADPFNIEAQAKIEEMIRQERVQENIQKALEENPESFARVTMLYIDVVVNNTPIKAFVDSGAQTTIMSPDAAERCGIRRLIDTRFGGIARGVGTAKILGRVHNAYIQIGMYSLASSFTVMEGKDVDLLLGLDMLKKHKMCIDLGQNCLVVEDEKVPFLPENEIPKMMDDILENEPKIEGPEGTKIGATTGSVEQVGSPTPESESTLSSRTIGRGNPASRIKIHPVGSRGNINSVSAAPSSVSRTSQPPSTPDSAFGQPQPITPESIAKITDLGFSREEAVQALEQVGGNVELAVGLLL